MSVLETPRIYFKGEVAWDPIVTNNYAQFYDEETALPVLPNAKTAAEQVKKFRKGAIQSVGTQGNTLTWNTDGTHRSSFYDTYVGKVDLGAGPVDDAFTSAPANFLGMLVDLEPYGTLSSQLFYDSMTFGIEGGCRIKARRRTRMSARYINFFRSKPGYRAGIGSSVWQATFAREDLQIDAFDSKALQALQAAMQDEDVLGLTVQWNAWRTIYYNDFNVIDPKVLGQHADQLVKQLEGGGFHPNPARSQVVGVIGLWRKGEPAHEPCDRVLIPGSGASSSYPTIGSAHARLGNDSIALDFSNAVSETGDTMVKHDFGELTVVAVDSGGNVLTTLGSFGYDRYATAAYNETSGIITLPLDPQNVAPAQTADLQVRDASGNVLLVEDAIRILPHVPNLYIDAGDENVARFQVYDRGVPAAAGVDMTMYVISSDGGTVDNTFALTSNAEGIVEFDVHSRVAGIHAYVPLAGADGTLPPGGINPQANTYMYVRILPDDQDIAAQSPTWDNVYGLVLANWNAMAPCMDNWLDLQNEAQVRSYAPLIKKLTSPKAFENYRYMPVTRDLTRGERTLLYNFLDSPAPTVALQATQVAETHDAAQSPDFAALNREMR
ncbi:MAG TPA: hypothetical protein VGF48_13065 [Thermoanaerobaculia bacterium]|jgi:hypothetical protein